MRNMTIALDDETFDASKAYAREHGTSVNAMIRQFLRATTAPASAQSPVQGFLALSREAHGHSGGRRWTREELHER